MKILLDVGHGGPDSGAVSGTVKESALNLALARMLGASLQGLGHAVVLTRNTDDMLEKLSLGARTDMSNLMKPDLFVSIHCNADGPTATGFEVWTSPGNTAADPYATAIYGALAETTGLVGRADKSDGDPDKESRFWVLVHTNAPAVLIEFGFLSNAHDRHLLLDELWRAKVCARLALAISGRTP
jgi:N-acetylmuramoyl-L-alanine amidase